MATLLLAEHDNKTLKDATNKALTAAKALGGEVHVLVAGAAAKPVAANRRRAKKTAGGVMDFRGAACSRTAIMIV